MQDNSQPVVDAGQLPEAVADATQPEVAPETTPAIDEAAIEARIRAQIEADFEDKRLKPLQRKLSEREAERHKAAQELAEARETLTRFETRMKDDGVSDDELALERFRAQEAARNVPPDATTQKEWEAVQRLAQDLEVVIFNPDSSVNQDLPWGDITAADTELEGLKILKAAIKDTATKKQSSTLEEKIRAEYEARIAEKEEEYKTELLKFQRVPTGGQGGGRSSRRFAEIEAGYNAGDVSIEEYTKARRERGLF